METLEILEEKIENIKWLLTPYFHSKKGGISESISLIRRSAGILSKSFPKGTAYEDKIRHEWEVDIRKRS